MKLGRRFHEDMLLDPLVIGAGIAAAAGLASMFGNTLSGMRNTDKTNQANKDIAADTNATNKAIADQNLAFQRENLDYQKALQQQLFEREDTSYQRTVQDMRAAGLSPLSMQNTNGAGEVVSTNALNNDYQAQQSAPMQAYNPDFQLGFLGDIAQNYADQRLKRDELRTQQQVSMAQKDLIEAQAAKEWTLAAYQDRMLEGQLEKLGLENKSLSFQNASAPVEFKKRMTNLDAQLEKLGLENKSLSFQNATAPVEFTKRMTNLDAGTVALNWQNKNSQRDYDYNLKFGLHDGQSELERMASILATQGHGDKQEHEFYAKELVAFMNKERLLDAVSDIFPGASGLLSAGANVVNTIHNLLPHKNKSNIQSKSKPKSKSRRK